MAGRLIRSALLLGLLIGCSDEGPQVPLLFVSPPDGSNGAGTVSSAPGGITCAMSGNSSTGTCSANYEAGATVTLTADAAPGSTFAGWGNGCAGTDPTCVVTLDASTDVTAEFQLINPRRLTVTVAGGGSGTITSNPGGLGCTLNGTSITGSCTAEFADGVEVTMNAAPAVGSGFTGWGDSCASSAAAPACTVTMSADRTATADFVSVSLGGFMASTSDATSGLLVVSIPVASAKVAPVVPPGVSLATVAGAVPAIGTVTYLGGDRFDVAGIYDPEQKELHLIATDFEVNGFLQGEVFGGDFSDNQRNVFGVISLATESGSAPPAAYCGTYQTDTQSPVPDSGSWNLVISGTSATGLSASVLASDHSFDTGFQPSDLVGEIRSGSVTLTVGDPGDPANQATGSLSTDGTTLSGAWGRTVIVNETTFVITGSWSASTGGCQ